MTEKTIDRQLSQTSTEDLKRELLELTQHRDTDSLSEKVIFYKNQLAPYFEELGRRNPVPTVEEQPSIILGVWTPVWSTIPFQDTIPGRLRDQSYQIFHDNGYYANMARYAPGSKIPFLQKFSSILLAYDFMILQKFEVRNHQWYIQNIGIEQAFRVRAIPLTASKAEDWFTAAVKSNQSKQKTASQPASAVIPPQIPDFKNLDKATAKKFEKIFLATPQLEHLYIDPDFRLIKSQREAKQRPSYTIAIRK